MKNLIRKILKEDFNREPVHGHSIPNGWVDGNTREFFEANGVKYRAIFPWNHSRNGGVTMQIVPYNDEDKAYYEEYSQLGPYGQEDYYGNGKIHLWKEEPGNVVYNALSSYLGSDHDWSVRKFENTEEQGGFLIYASMNLFELVEDFLNIVDEGYPM
jgi:hypothetical protein